MQNFCFSWFASAWPRSVCSAKIRHQPDGFIAKSHRLLAVNSWISSFLVVQTGAFCNIIEKYFGALSL